MDAEKVEEFKKTVIELCRKFDVTLTHEDVEGCLVIRKGFNKEHIANLLMDAYYEEEK